MKVVELERYQEAKRIVTINPLAVSHVEVGPFKGSTRVWLQGIGILVRGKRSEIVELLFGRKKR